MDGTTKIGISSQTLVSSAVPAARLPQYIAALIATIGGFSIGTTLGWTSPIQSMLNQYDFNISSDQFSWIGAFMALGAMAGSAGTGAMANMFGRKKTIIILTIPMTLAWLLIIWGPNVLALYIGRFITGFSGGGFTVVVPLYTSELSETEIRGTLGTYFQLQLTLGILLPYVLGSFVTIFSLTVVCAIVPVILAATMIFMPESPIYYLKKFRLDDARRSLQWFRGSHYDVEPELQEKKQNLDQMEAEKVPITQAFTTTPAKRGLVIGLGVMFFQQFSGINAVIFYASKIFKDAGSDLNENLSAIIVGVIMVFMTWVSSLVIDRAGRRPLLLISALIMAICSAVLGIYFYIKNISPETAKTIGLIPITSLSLFVIAFSLGFGPIPWMFMSEIFPPQIKGSACSIACLFNWLCVFFVTKYYNDLVSVFNTYCTFWIFAGISVAGTIFVWNLVPETKGKSMEEIQRELGAIPQMSVEEPNKNSDQKPTKL
ncbi:trehalose transporter 1-like protein [Lycorma delicatula]|uniref:trehalose transporter 1-like protein n=1 Tax=Lycorma delicatula TaxID=130591 RepID=UPI003F50F680